MGRRQLFEILDQRWCPQPVRDGATDYLEAVTSIADIYAGARGLIEDAIAASGHTAVVDLCSGGGGPWLSRSWCKLCSQRECPLQVALTDKFPSKVLTQRVTSDAVSIEVIKESTDAVCLPENLRGFRTIFASFHHFPDSIARQMLEDAERDGSGFASAEVTSRTLRAFVVIFFLPLTLLVLTPFQRPFRWSRLLLTYLLPAIPFTVWWDGLVSCLRTRTPAEMLRLTEGLNGLEWSSGYAPGFPLRVLYLIGRKRSVGTPEYSLPKNN
jgi:hypothetical protein